MANCDSFSSWEEAAVVESPTGCFTTLTLTHTQHWHKLTRRISWRIDHLQETATVHAIRKQTWTLYWTSAQKQWEVSSLVAEGGRCAYATDASVLPTLFLGFRLIQIPDDSDNLELFLKLFRNLIFLVWLREKVYPWEILDIKQEFLSS